MLKLAYSLIYIYQLPAGHRFPMSKYELIPQQLLHEGTVEDVNFFHPVQAADIDILRAHTLEYLEKLHHLTLSAKEIRDIGFPVRDQLITRGKHIAQGTIDCALFALEYGVSMNIAGGTHHAFSDHGEGFCIFNDFAIAAHYLLAKAIVQKILIVDLDVHQGNGTAKIFDKDPRVFTWSVHGDRNYPLRKMHSDLDTALPDGTSDQDYLKVVSNILPQLIDRVQPDLILYLAGVDVLETDRLGRMSLSRSGCKKRDEMVLKMCRINKIPVAVSMGGGYSPRMAHIIEAHCNTFRIAQEIYF